MPTLRTMPKVMTLTDAAAARVRTILAESPGALGLRLGIKKGGCAGMEYTLDVAEEKGPHEEVVEHEGAVVLIEPTAIMYLVGTEMDFQSDKLGSQFVFNNPNQVGSCGCGVSVNLMPADDAQTGAQPTRAQED
jgi:iron-sulfur cluster assembly protein